MKSPRLLLVVAFAMAPCGAARAQVAPVPAAAADSIATPAPPTEAPAVVQPVAAQPVAPQAAAIEGVTAANPIPCQPPAAGATPIETIVESAMRDVLGWRPRTSDPRGFVAALSQSLTPAQVEGRVEWRWTPRAMATQTDLGGVTGAQAALYGRAQAMLERTLPLLESLQPMVPNLDPIMFKDAKKVVRDDLHSVADELMRKGGPRAQKSAEVFGAMLGARSKSVGIVEVKGSLRVIADRLGLDPEKVGTVEEEQNLSNFLILADYVHGLERCWRRYLEMRPVKKARPGDPMLALGGAVDSAAQSVEEIRFAMDAVALGPAERQVIPLCFRGEKQLSLAELLEWTQSFASEEAPQLAGGGGSEGLAKAAKQASHLAALLAGARIPPQDPARLPAGFRTASVQRALTEASAGLARVARLAEQAQKEDGKGKRRH